MWERNVSKDIFKIDIKFKLFEDISIEVNVCIVSKLKGLT